MVHSGKEAIQDVLAERERQDAKWGKQNHTPVWWHAILSEEVGEVAKAILEAQFAAGSVEAVRDELVQVAAVAIAAIESIDRGDQPLGAVTPIGGNDDAIRSASKPIAGCV